MAQEIEARVRAIMLPKDMPEEEIAEEKAKEKAIKAPKGAEDEEGLVEA